jgi:hypothetical protein
LLAGTAGARTQIVSLCWLYSRDREILPNPKGDLDRPGHTASQCKKKKKKKDRNIVLRLLLLDRLTIACRLSNTIFCELLFLMVALYNLSRIGACMGVVMAGMCTFRLELKQQGGRHAF